MGSLRSSAPDQTDVAAWLDDAKPSPATDPEFAKFHDAQPPDVSTAKALEAWLDAQEPPKPVAEPKREAASKRAATVDPRQPYNSIAAELRASDPKALKLAADLWVPMLASLIADYTNTGVLATPGIGVNGILAQASNGSGGFQVSITQPAAAEKRHTFTPPPNVPNESPSLANPNVIAWLDRLLADLRGTPTTQHTPLLVLCESETVAPGALRDRKAVRELKERLTELASQHSAVIGVVEHYPGLSPALQILPLDGVPGP